MKKALKRMAAAALVTLSVLRGGDAFAQNAVDGRVVDANGAPLVGVTVLIKGTQSGTATGANGSYSIKAREDQTLVFSYLGYTTVEEYVGKRTAINVKMTEEASQIGAVEIVNIGYGTTTRRDLTGSVAKADLGVENLEALEKGLPNLLHHIENITVQYGLPAVVAINRFPTDTEKELELIAQKCKEYGANVSLSEVWAKGGEGGLDLAREVMRLCEQPNHFKPIYEDEMPLKQKIDNVVKSIYG